MKTEEQIGKVATVEFLDSANKRVFYGGQILGVENNLLHFRMDARIDGGKLNPLPAPQEKSFNTNSPAFVAIHYGE
jgi:hypothetical protein